MSVIFWILIVISVVVALLTSGMIWAVSKFMMPPMIDAVPNLKWTGLAKALVGLSDLVSQYPLLLAVWPCAILCVGIFVHNAKKSLIISVVLTVMSVGLLLGMLFLAVAGSHVMEEQLVSGMGLGI